MTPALAARIHLPKSDLRPAVDSRLYLLRHQLRVAETSNSPTLREVLAGNVELLREIAA